MVRDFSQIVDFYYWKGIPVARLWPRKTLIPPSSAMMGARLAFIQSRVDLRSVPHDIRQLWREHSTGKKQAWLDYYTGVYMRVWRDYKRYPAVVTGFVITRG